MGETKSFPKEGPGSLRERLGALSHRRRAERAAPCGNRSWLRRATAEERIMGPPEICGTKPKLASGVETKPLESIS